MHLGWYLAAAIAADLAASAAHVEIEAVRAVVQAQKPQAQLQVLLRARNRLPYPVDRVHLGVVFAAAPAALEGLDPGALYRGETRPGVGMLHRAVAASLPAEGSAELAWEAPLPAGAVSPQAFAVHVLSYRLAEVDAATLMRLLSGSAAADERAACDTLALLDGAAAKQAVRRQLGPTPLAAGLAAVALAPPAAKPSQAEAFRHVYAICALGVLGGPQAEVALQALAHSPGLAAWDEPLQILRIARVRGSVWETPLAFAIPASARRMQEVVQAAQEALRRLPDGPDTEDPGPHAPAAAPNAPPAREPWQPSPWLGAVLACGALGWLGWRIWRRSLE